MPESRGRVYVKKGGGKMNTIIIIIKSRTSMMVLALMADVLASGVVFMCIRSLTGNEVLAGHIGVVFLVLTCAIVCGYFLQKREAARRKMNELYETLDLE
jgi:hypothetical protein